MQTGYISNLQFKNNPFANSAMGQNPVNPFSNGQSPSALGSSGQSSFKNVLSNTLGTVNELTSKPDKMLMEAVTSGTYDVHDVMMASAKAELAISITAQLTTKVVQAYDKILQIQV